ncbi:MAG: DUF1223 domain-containing protein [Proteobacteria bacterium]|nr:DUF1223 domain-containing protein [Pseudomonadota bacterium]
MSPRWIVPTLLLVSTAVAHAGPRPAVVELFTSQGCSSCPPADAYVGQLSKRPDVIALAFHVTYWDDLGWRDRFALTEAVDRQNVYARNLRRSTVYTPQLIVDGLDDRAGTAARLAASDGIPVAITVTASNLQVEVGTGSNPTATHIPPSGDVVLVSYLRHAVSAIGRGENAGRKLEEFNIVRSIRKLGVWSGGNAKFSVAVGSLPTDATDVAVLVQGVGQRAIVGAAAQALR